MIPNLLQNSRDERVSKFKRRALATWVVESSSGAAGFTSAGAIHNQFPSLLRAHLCLPPESTPPTEGLGF